MLRPTQETEAVYPTLSPEFMLQRMEEIIRPSTLFDHDPLVQNKKIFRISKNPVIKINIWKNGWKILNSY